MIKDFRFKIGEMVLFSTPNSRSRLEKMSKFEGQFCIVLEYWEMNDRRGYSCFFQIDQEEHLAYEDELYSMEENI